MFTTTQHSVRILLSCCLLALAAPQVLAELGPSEPHVHEDEMSLSKEAPKALAAARQAGTDSDGDGLDDFADNCVGVANADQRDTDGDGYGNVCDADITDNGVVNAGDLGLLKQAFFASPGAPNWNPHADFNGDDVVNVIDLGMMRAAFFQPPGPSGMACAGSAPCPPPELEFSWPMPGNDADDWVINNSVDLDPSSGVMDFAGGSKSYNGHRGVDIDVPTFRAMDNNFPIFAVANGVVLAFEDGKFDRNTSCTGSWNYVTVGHPNGWKTIYGHLKKNSVAVNVGDVVHANSFLGVVGSSGCSTHPHLHLETIDANGNTVEPFAQGMWQSPPVYDTPIGFMDGVLYAERITHVDMIKDPEPNATIVPPGESLGLGLSMAGGRAGDSINLRVTKNGAILGQTTINFSQVYRHSFWWWNYTLPANASGAHRAEIRVNGSLVRIYNFDVYPVYTGYYQTRHGVPAASFGALFDAMVANGYRLTWIDGYRAGGGTYFNATFDRSQVLSWTAVYGLTSSTYNAFFDGQVQAGRRLVHVDSYRQGSAIRYAAIFVEQTFGPLWVAYHNASQSSHQALFNSYASQGYNAKVISVVDAGGGNLRFTALYDKLPVGGWVALANLTSAQYQSQFNAQIAAGRRLAYINAYSNNGVPNFTAIWNSVQPSSWVARHDLTSAQFQNEFDTWTGAGFVTRMITGYDNGAGSHRFAGYWTN